MERSIILRPEKREWLVHLRNTAGLTQKEVAEIVGIERSTYAKAELGYPVSVPTAKHIADVLNFQWTAFFE